MLLFFVSALALRDFKTSALLVNRIFIGKSSLTGFGLHGYTRVSCLFEPVNPI